LIAELLVGQWSDFGDSTHPCEWVHRHAAGVASTPPQVQSVLALASHLYPHALFKAGHVQQAAKIFYEARLVEQESQPITRGLLKALGASAEGASSKPIRETLARDYSLLDPAVAAPSDPAHPLRLVEDSFCQSIEQGRVAAQQPLPSRVEDSLLGIFEAAEGEWDVLGRESAIAIQAVCVLRKLAAMVTKRAIGLRLGYHALDLLLADYEACLRDPTRLGAVRNALQPLLGEPGVSFNLVEILGQPTAESQSQPMVCLQGQAPGARALPAPAGTGATPGHDLPCIEVTEPPYQIPLTFDFYMALRLRKDGCAGSSLPASVRAALDRVRHRYAGQLCRQEDRFLDGRASIVVGTRTKIGITSPGEPPALIEN
jgi:hypothetical protein